MSLTSFSIREQLGPIVFSFRDASGADHEFRLDNPRLFPISEFPRRAADELGVDTVETVGFHFQGLGDPEIDLFEQGLKDSGTSLLNICLDLGDLSDTDDDRRAADVELTERWIDRFAAMGSRFVRVNPASPFAVFDDGLPPAHLVDTLGALGDYATSRGTRLLVENHVGASSDPAWMSVLLESVGHDRLGLLLDLGNFPALRAGLETLRMAEGRTPTDAELKAVAATLELESLYAGILALAPYAEMISVKEHLVLEDGTIGFVDLARAAGNIVSAGFDGPWSVEYEGFGGDPWAKSRRVLEATREIVSGLRVGA